MCQHQRDFLAAPKQKIEIRDFQAVDKAKLEEALRSSSALFQAPCGYGKTVLMAFLVHDMLASGKRVAVVFNRRVLYNQTIDKFESVDPEIIRDIGVMFAEFSGRAAALHLRPDHQGA